MKDRRIEAQMDAIGRALWPLLTPTERKMLEIRPSVSHGDIEILLNGRFWPVDADHFEKVMASDGVKTWVEGMLPRLRGHKYLFDSESPPNTRGKYQYSFGNVLREIHYVLITLLGPFLTEKKVKDIQEHVQAELLKTFNVVKRPRRNPEYTDSEYQLINKILIEELGKILQKDS